MELQIVLLIYGLCYALAATLNSFSLEPGNVAEKNSEIRMICSVTISSSDNTLSLEVYKGAVTDDGRIATCYISTGGGSCIREADITTRYAVTYTQQSLVVTISNLEISDRGNWYCGFNGQIQTKYVLSVYLSPVGLAFDGGSAGGDLAATDVTLNCKTTTCVFPAPAEFQWFYKKTNRQWLSYTTTSVTGSHGSCSGEERIYSTTLSLPRNTTWPLQPPNVDTTVALQCRMEFVTLTSALHTGQTGDVIYAVQVSNVTLRDGNTLPTNSSTITVTSSLSKALTCSPSLSRPDSTVVWYIGGVENQRSNTNTNYVFTPINNDHNKQIYCKAYNFQSESQAVYSYKPVLYVRDPPHVSMLHSTTDMSEGNELILTCNAKGVPSVYNYNTLSQTWGNSVIHNTHSAVSGTPMYSSLHIPSLQLQDSGTYTCRVNNGITNTRGVLEDSIDSVFVKVKVSPKIITQGLTFTGVTGGTANIRVEFYSYPDILNVTFKRYDGLAITNGGKYNVSHYGTEVSDTFHGTDVTLDGSQANMIISDLKPEDFGVYTLTLSNQLSTTDRTFLLDAESLPEEPTHFTYLFKDNAHTFSWIGGFNGGFSQTFVVQTSIVGTEEWINRTTITEIGQGVASYKASITTLPPGTYVSRIFAWTIKGTSDYVRLNDTFSSSKISPGPETQTFPVAVVAGWVSTVIVFLIISTGAVVVHKRRYEPKDRHSARTANRKSRNTTVTVEETSYYSVANQGDTTSQQAAVSELRIKSGTVQKHDLQDVSTYEALDASNEAVSTYSSLTPAVERHEDTMAYNNLQLHQLFN